MSMLKNYRHRGVTHPLVIDRRIKQAIESAFKVSDRQGALLGVKIVVCHAVPCHAVSRALLHLARLLHQKWS